MLAAKLKATDLAAEPALAGAAAVERLGAVFDRAREIGIADLDARQQVSPQRLSRSTPSDADIRRRSA